MTPQEIELKFKRIGEMMVEKVSRLQRAVFFDISGRVIDTTPVDTGRARSGWHADVDKFNTDKNVFPKEKRITAAEASAKAMASVAAATASHSPGQSLTLANSVEYIPYLNSGSSKQAPNGMTDAAINAFRGLVEVHVRRV